MIFQTSIIWSNRIHSLKYLRSTLICKDIGIKKFEFVAKTQFFEILKFCQYFQSLQTSGELKSHGEPKQKCPESSSIKPCSCKERTSGLDITCEGIGLVALQVRQLGMGIILGPVYKHSKFFTFKVLQGPREHLRCLFYSKIVLERLISIFNVGTYTVDEKCEIRVIPAGYDLHRISKRNKINL